VIHRQGSIGRFAATALLVAALVGGCGAGPTPPASFLPGTGALPRELNLIASDYAFTPAVVRVVPGETVLVHVINGGLEPHEAVIGDAAVQTAWEDAEARTAGHPPGPTPVVSVAPGLAGVRAFVASGQRVDVRWTVPTLGDGATATPSGAWFVGCHIPGHFEKGMVIPIEFVARVGG
jgi:FtsP/CotA-like multicopper oxidase with cupredoxin domain